MQQLRRVGRMALLAGLGACTMIGSPELETRSPERARPAVSEGVPAAAAAPRAPEPPSAGGNMAEYEIWGRRYRVLDSSYGYDERGVASWYGDEFHGRPTSSGEPFDKDRLSAAHRSLPLPAWVRVTNLANGRSLVLRVNDRGPFSDPDRRIIDVSHAAAVELGMVETGTASVRVQAVEPWQSRTPGSSGGG
jgi:rare lipoprotein A